MGKHIGSAPSLGRVSDLARRTELYRWRHVLECAAALRCSCCTWRRVGKQSSVQLTRGVSLGAVVHLSPYDGIACSVRARAQLKPNANVDWCLTRPTRCTRMGNCTSSSRSSDPRSWVTSVRSFEGVWWRASKRESWVTCGSLFQHDRVGHFSQWKCISASLAMCLALFSHCGFECSATCLGGVADNV